MSVRLPILTLLLLVGCMSATALAKPPDLPVNEVIDCVAQAPEQPIDGLLLELVIEKKTCPMPGIVIDLVCPPLRLRHFVSCQGCPCMNDCCCPCLDKALQSCRRLAARCFGQTCSHQKCSQGCYPSCPGCPGASSCGHEEAEAVQGEVEILDVMPQEVEEIDIMPDECPPEGCHEDSKASSCPKPAWDAPTCPYLRGKGMLDTAPKKGEPHCGTVLENFDKLLLARKMYRKGERYLRAGDCDAACACYEKVKKLCPGSRFEHMACERLEQLYVLKGMHDVKPAVEEAEPLPCHPTEVEQKHEQMRAACMALVDELREKGHRLIEEGHYAEAGALADLAVRLSTDTEAVFEFLTKAQELLNKKHEESEPGCHTDQPDSDSTDDPAPNEEASEAASGDPITTPEVTLQPALPPIDPKIVDALEKVLRQVGDPTIPKLIVGSDAPVPEEQEEPVSQWPLVPPETEMPSLYVDPIDEDLVLDEDGASADGKASTESSLPNCGDILREALDAIKQKACCEVEFSPEGLRARMTFQVNGVECCVVMDNWGHRFVTVRLKPEATGDLRAVQQAHTERVVRWIERMNSGGFEVDDDGEACEDPEDLDDLLDYLDPYPL